MCVCVCGQAAKYNDKKTFDVVLGLFLSPVRRACDGALFVRPGSQTHERQERLAGRLAPGALHSREADVGTALHASDDDARVAAAAAAAASATTTSCDDAPRGDGTWAQPILCDAGSVIVFDKDLLHAGGPNLSADIRYALYARMRFERQ